MKILITGGCGFLGSNLALKAISNGDDLLVFDNLSRIGSKQNLLWMKEKGKFSFVEGDVSKRDQIESTIREFKPAAIFHLAGQVAMTTSIEDPRRDFEVNALGTLNILEACRLYSKESIILYSSTNKVYGDLLQYKYVEKDKRYECIEFPNGFTEDISLDFHSPYGCSKGTADQYLLDYYRMFGIRTVVFRHSSMFGFRQFSTFDQGWVGWFCKKAIDQYHNSSEDPFTINGNGKQVRDILFSEDMVDLYFSSLDKIDIVQGNAFNIGGGMVNSLSLLELFDYLDSRFNIKLNYRILPPRESDQLVFVSDTSKILNKTGWQPKINKFDGVEKMLEWLLLGIS
jgi:CDP-paratose 2-epimerase